MNAAARTRLLHAIHRRMGVCSALFVILLAVTGALLQHSSTLGVDNDFVSPGFAKVWYGIVAPEAGPNYAINGNLITSIGDALYCNGERLPGRFTEPRGGVAFAHGLAIATASTILLLTPEGEIIETLTVASGLPENIERIGTTPDGSIYLQASNAIVEVDLDAASFVTAEQPEAPISWSSASPIDGVLESTIKEDYAGTLISWERLILDIHTGRLLGTFGVVLVDLMAALFLLLALTGVWSWSRRRGR